mmetsp:Transcript_1576/g.5057  ORF Transcript_1576/g.5057 Transcript_1576/m.5057 type:complete len:210 (-) Transcript_1576:35-664(-)
MAQPGGGAPAAASALLCRKHRRATAVLGGGEAGACRRPRQLARLQDCAQERHVRHRLPERRVLRGAARRGVGNPADLGGGVRLHPLALPLVGAPVLGRCATVRDFLAHRRSKGHPAAAPHPRRRVRGEEARAAGRPGAVPPLLSLGAAVRLGVQFDVGTALREGRKGAAGGVESHQGGSIAMPGPALAVAACVCGFRPWPGQFFQARSS